MMTIEAPHIDCETLIYRADALRRHPDWPGKDQMVADYLQEIDERADVPSKTKDRIKEILSPDHLRKSGEASTRRPPRDESRGPGVPREVKK